MLQGFSKKYNHSMIDLNYIVLVISIGLVVILIYSLAMKYVDKPVQEKVAKKYNPFRDETREPSEIHLESFLGKIKLELFNSLLKQISQLGEPKYFWRGNDNGWVLSLAGSDCENGSFILAKNKIIGQMALGRNQLWGIRSDERLPTNFSLDLWLTYTDDNSQNRAFLEFPIESEKSIKDFVKLIELNKWYA